MSCGSPMPRGERIAKPAEWGTPIRPVFHSLRGEPNPEASMRTRFALVALAVALSTACGEGPLVPTSGAIRIVLTTIGADPDADGYAVTLDGAAPRTVGVNGTLVLRDLGTGAHSVTLAGLAANCTAGGGKTPPVTLRARDTPQGPFPGLGGPATRPIRVQAAHARAHVRSHGY